jgi:Endoglucanase
MPEFPFHNSGKFMVDATGRAVFFHGVNMVNKFPPFTPAALGFGDADIKILVEAGLNVVRVGVLYSGVEPVPGTIDEAYLNKIAETVDLLGKQGIYSLLDFHQDLYGPTFTGDGFPQWATQTDGLPTLPNLGFPNDYFELPSLQRAFDNFWKNSPGPDGLGLQDHYAAAWQRVAKRFAGHRWVMGYDLFNEPFPGSDWQACNPDGCKSFDPILGAFMAKVAKAIAAVDSQHMIFYEPPVLLAFGIPTMIPSPGGKRVGMSFHNYWPKDFNLPIQIALQQSQKTGDALFMTEFGASVDPAPVIKVAELADASLISWIYWAYANNTPFQIATPGLPPTPQQQGIVLNLSLPRRGSNLNTAILKAVSRPYPVAVAGTPLSFSYEGKTGVFKLSYRRVALGSALKSDETVVVVPPSRYPKGYHAEVMGGKVMSPAHAMFLRIFPEGKSESVELSVSPVK